MKKIDILIPLAIGIMMIIIIGAVVSMTILDGKQDEKLCSNICESNGYYKIRTNSGGFQNDICYCKDSQSKIYTFVM